MLLINLSKQADQFLDKLPPKQFKQIVKELFRLAKNPEQQDIIKLKGSDDFFRKDVGECYLSPLWSHFVVTLMAPLDCRHNGATSFAP